MPHHGLYFFGLDRALGTALGAATANEILPLTII
jgi:hypothetical protein